MSEFDPTIARSFEWTRAHSIDEIMTDPECNARFNASYEVDPDYRRPECRTEDRQVPGFETDRTTAVRVYTPTDGEPSAVLVWSHGGGWVSGTLDQQEGDGVARELATRANALVVSVGYRLADGEGVAYPQLHREVVAAFLWARQRAEELGLDPDAVQLGGGSAGANISFSAALELIDRGLPLPARLQLIYPLVHRTLPPMDRGYLDVVPEVLRLRQSVLDPLVGAYLRDDPAPYFEMGDRDLGDLPPTFVVACEYDELRSSGEALAQKMRDDGADVTFHLAEGTIHAHLNLSGTASETANTLDLMADQLRHRP